MNVRGVLTQLLCAGQHTFVVPCRGAVLGRCSRQELQDGVEGPIGCTPVGWASSIAAVGDEPVCCAVVDGALQSENVLSRAVAARFQGFAQINYDPGRYDDGAQRFM